MSSRPVIHDNHGRPITYLRLSVTDRCNLRCNYCMPEQTTFVAKEKLLSYEELIRLVQIFADLGIYKVRITGGEPFVRKDIMTLLRGINNIEGINSIHLTTNGVLTAPHVNELKNLGIDSVNLSLDTLDRQRFYQITRRDMLNKVMETFYALLDTDINVKINAVIVKDLNTQDIISLAKLTKKYPVAVRFIEEMPFNGTDSYYEKLEWDYQRIVKELNNHFGEFEKAESSPNSTSINYKIPGHKGEVGVISAYSRTFCGTCNRIRLTALGMLKTCLYDDGVLNIRHLLRAGKSNAQIKNELKKVFNNRVENGFQAERDRSNKLPVSESMSVIGG
ncbi:MAG TPA: GTP 3',8-cyclase MoaA [Bacteroidales bacterium]|nr:GTP 3',8-cyclase MoaA [Bacteroidales bacterium]